MSYFQAKNAPNSILQCIFSLKIWHLVATILMIFLRIDLPNFVQLKQYWGKLGPRHAFFCSKQDFHYVYINGLKTDTYKINSLNADIRYLNGEKPKMSSDRKFGKGGLSLPRPNKTPPSGN